MNMNKQHLKNEISEIEFPQSEVFDAINSGIKKGRKEKGSGRMPRIKMIGTVSSIAASAFLASGLIFAPITNVLASVPIIGSIYDKFSLQIGHELLESNLITQLNEEAKSNGINMTITSAYYDGNVIGITFKADSDSIALNKIGDKGPETEYGYSFHLFNGNEQEQWSSTMTQLEKSDDGYIAAMEFYNPDADLPENYTLPLTFTSITGVKGIWKFDIPVKQIPSETVTTEGKSIFKDYSIQVESVIKGKATTFLKYKTTLPLVGKNDDINITVFDNEGNRLSKNRADVLSAEQNNDVVVKDVRELFNSKIKENTKYLTIQPEIRRHEQEALSSLEKNTPFIVDSKRFDYKIRVNNIEQNGNQVILNYNVQNVETKDFRKDIIQNFADFIMIIKSDKIRESESGELDMKQMLEHRIRSNQAKETGDDNLHFRSVFTIENSVGFNIKDYSLMVPFGTLSSNTPIEMEPIKIELGK
ncbi:DUF4179 domain-containing protein [Bacillus marinisedimentorum]|uniref:DUF4179 domain-containing protein n=1 Tax=Bacillus marinisedimentorum TaxID=1821260 RepID=UPI0008723A30|nr:DUF4179 domain-containing protein [Bacillus marinisedimentorum]